MQWILRFTVIAVVGSAAFARATPPDAEPLMAAARRALGGDIALGAVRSFSVTGPLQRQLEPGAEFAAREIKCALPDRFLRTENQASGPDRYYFGFDRDVPVFEAQLAPRRDSNIGGISAAGAMSGPSPAPWRGLENALEVSRKQHDGAKHAFAELVLPLFAASFAAYPLTFTVAGQVTLASGLADAVDATGPDGFTLRLLLDAASHRPVRLTWMAQPAVMFETSTKAPFNIEDRSAWFQTQWAWDVSSATFAALRTDVARTPLETTQGLLDPLANGQTGAKGPVNVLPNALRLPKVEWQIVIADYRMEGHLTWPHRLTVSAGGKPYEDVRMGKFTINPRFDAGAFRPVSR
jgi:hypothetical protein